MAEPLQSLLDHLRGKDGKVCCPWCGGGDFHLLPSDEQPLALLRADEGTSWYRPPSYLKSYALTCKHCCFVAVVEARNQPK